MQDQDGSFFLFNQGESGLPQPERVPPAIQGEGGRAHTLAVANKAAGIAQSFEELEAWMRAWNLICEPPWTGRGTEGIDYWSKDAWAFVRGEKNPESPEEILEVVTKKVSIPELNLVASTAAGQYGQFLNSVKDQPIPSPEEVIDQLYPGNPLLCRARESEAFAFTAPRESIRGYEGIYEWIVPSPMRKVHAKNQKGEKSFRCRNNAALKRAYIVVEFDFTPKFKKHINAWAEKGISPRDVQIALFWHLARTGEPRAFPFMIVDSGGKSLHSWFAISPKFPEGAALALLARAIPLGADARAGQPEQFFRFPGGTRSSEKDQPQTILFYDPRTK